MGLYGHFDGCVTPRAPSSIETPAPVGLYQLGLPINQSFHIQIAQPTAIRRAKMAMIAGSMVIKLSRASSSSLKVSRVHPVGRIRQPAEPISRAIFVALDSPF